MLILFKGLAKEESVIVGSNIIRFGIASLRLRVGNATYRSNFILERAIVEVQVKEV